MVIRGAQELLKKRYGIDNTRVFANTWIQSHPTQTMAAAPPKTPSKKDKKEKKHKKKKSILKVADPTKEKNIVILSSPDDEVRNTVFFKLQNIPVHIIEEFARGIHTWVQNQNTIGGGKYVELCGPAVFTQFPLDKIKVKQTDEEKKEKKRLYNIKRNQREDVKQKRKERMESPEAKKKREEQSKDENFKKRKRETAQDLRRATKKVKLEHRELWDKIRAEVKAERLKATTSESQMSVEEAPPTLPPVTVQQETAKRVVQRAGKTVATQQWTRANEANDALSSSETSETTSETETSETTVEE